MQSMRFWNCPYAAMVVEDYGTGSGAYHLARSQAAGWEATSCGSAKVAGRGQVSSGTGVTCNLEPRGGLQIPGERRRWPCFTRADITSLFSFIKVYIHVYRRHGLFVDRS